MFALVIHLKYLQKAGTDMFAMAAAASGEVSW